jgi:hypothetical protein
VGRVEGISVLETGTVDTESDWETDRHKSQDSEILVGNKSESLIRSSWFELNLLGPGRSRNDTKIATAFSRDTHRASRHSRISTALRRQLETKISELRELE